MDRRKKGIITAIMVAMFLAAVEGTIVTTAIPTITKDLQGFELISWIFSIYLFTSAISTPIYGKLSDLYGRKNMLSIGIVVFLLGSTLCGLSHSMFQLIAFRALQGLGAGAIFTITFTIVGDVFTLSERAKVQGWLGSVWGISSLVGPFLGGFFIETLSWHWIFFINVPFGILSIFLLQRNLDEHFEKKKHSIDYLGIGALSATIVVILNGIVNLENTTVSRASFLAWTLIGTVAMLAAFVYIEKKAAEPVIPFDIFTRSTIFVNIISFFVASVLIGVSVYMPIYTQNVLGYNALISGLAMVPMSAGWIFASVLMSKKVARYGERLTVSIAAFILALGSVLLGTLGVDSSLLAFIGFVFILGMGFGIALTTLTIVIQSSVSMNKRGVAVATNSLVRTLGQTIGISAFGSIFNLGIVQYFIGKGQSGFSSDNLRAVSGLTKSMPVTELKFAVNASLHTLFITFFVIACICLLFALLLSNDLKEKNA